MAPPSSYPKIVSCKKEREKTCLPLFYLIEQKASYSVHRLKVKSISKFAITIHENGCSFNTKGYKYSKFYTHHLLPLLYNDLKFHEKLYISIFNGFLFYLADFDTRFMTLISVSILGNYETAIKSLNKVWAGLKDSYSITAVWWVSASPKDWYPSFLWEKFAILIHIDNSLKISAQFWPKIHNFDHSE